MSPVLRQIDAGSFAIEGYQDALTSFEAGLLTVDVTNGTVDVTVGVERRGDSAITNEGYLTLFVDGSEVDMITGISPSTSYQQEYTLSGPVSGGESVTVEWGISNPDVWTDVLGHPVTLDGGTVTAPATANVVSVSAPDLPPGGVGTVDVDVDNPGDAPAEGWTINVFLDAGGTVLGSETVNIPAGGATVSVSIAAPTSTGDHTVCAEAVSS